MTVKRGAGRKSQISIFMILGFALVLLIAITIFSKQAILGDIKQQQRAQFQGNFDSTALEQYVSFCLSNSSYETARILGMMGGSSNQTELAFNSRHYLGQDFRLLCIAIPGAKGCINRMLTLKVLENEMSLATLRTLDRCLDLDYFKTRGYVVSQGEPKLLVKISPDKIKFYLDYELSMKKDTVIVKSDSFFTEVSHPLGSAYMISQDIINTEASNIVFDKDRWMNENNLIFKIEKLSPYPYVLYKLVSNDKYNLTFQFGILHEDSATRTNLDYGYELEYGCCYVGNGCFKNSDYSTCVSKKGTYEPHVSCSCGVNLAYSSESTNEDTDNIMPSKKGCQTKKDGESWCINQDGVGGVDKKMSCHDGQVYTEYCRDFHEEVCVEFSNKNLSNAVCKPNRWMDCTKCDNKECCLNDALRDCRWVATRFSVISESPTPSCLPKLAPGFKFWDTDAQNICNLGTKYALCNGESCGQEAIQHYSDICSMLGDCGIKANLQSAFSKGGFFETDPIVNPENTRIPRPFMSLNSDQAKLFSSKSKDSIELIPALISAWVDYLADSASSRKTTLDFAFCNLWQPPMTNDCSTCEIGNRCSEYKCKSISQECYYHEDDGFPKCDKILKSTNLMQISLATNISFAKTTINFSRNRLTGFEIEKPFLPFREINFKIATTERSKCKITYLPDVGYINSPAIWFGDPVFSKTHEVRMRLPENIRMPDILGNKLGIQSLSDLYDMIVANNKSLSKIFNSNSMSSIKLLNLELSKRPYLRELLRLSLSSLENNTYFVFIRCADESGVENRDPIYLKFRIDNSSADSDPPRILGSKPENGSLISILPYQLEIYADEPAECRLSNIDEGINGMPFEMDCNNHNMIISHEAGGSYICSINTSIKEPFIRCIDQPSSKKQFTLRVKILHGNLTTDPNSSVPTLIAGLETFAYEHEIGNSEAILAFNTSEAITRLSLKLDGDYSCNSRVGNSSVALSEAMECEPDEIYGTICSEMVSSGNYHLTLSCAQNDLKQRNANIASTRFNFSTSGTFSIINYYPVDNDRIGNIADFSVFVNKNIDDNQIDCGYAIDGSAELFSMNRLGNYQFKKQSLVINNGLHQVMFRCSDKNGITTTRKVVFSVE